MAQQLTLNPGLGLSGQAFGEGVSCALAVRAVRPMADCACLVTVVSCAGKPSDASNIGVLPGVVHPEAHVAAPLAAAPIQLVADPDIWHRLLIAAWPTLCLPLSFGCLLLLAFGRVCVDVLFAAAVIFGSILAFICPGFPHEQSGT